MKHNVENYIETLKECFKNEQKINRRKLITLISEHRQIGYLEAEKILNVCRAKGVVKSHHLHSTYFYYTLEV